MKHVSSRPALAISFASIIGVCLLGVVGCSSESSQPNNPQGKGGSGIAGTAAGGSGSPAGTGGVTSGTGGGGGSGTSGAGGNASGGSAAGGGGTGGGGGASATAGTGGATGGVGGGAAGSAQGGMSGSSGGRGGGAPAGSGGSAGGGSGGNGAGDGGMPVDGGGPSAGCGKNTTRPDRRAQQTMTIGGTTRYYLLNVPSGATSTPLPLVFALHGYDMNNVALVDLYDFTAQSGNKAITVLPQGEGPAPGNTSHWGDQVLKSTWTANAANYDFIQTLRADIESKYCVDATRVYITGFSMGGMFTNSLACAHHDWFRGYAPVEGGGPGSCADANAKPAIIIHQGTADTIAKPEAGEGTRDFWTRQNGCNTMTSSIYTGCSSYGACAAPVLYCVGNWDHTVSSTARANIWKFFDSLK
jgi:poly(3-hydroxybutyrate) depolymerase